MRSLPPEGQPRVDDRGEQVDSEVHHDEGRDTEQGDRLHDGEVLGRHRLHEQGADAGHVEGGLDDRGADEQTGEHGAADGDDGAQRVAQHVSADHGPTRDASGARHLDVVASEFVEHRRAGHPGEQSREGQRQSEGGQREVVEPVRETLRGAARSREPAQLDGEQRDERHGAHEGGRRRGHPRAEEHRAVHRAGAKRGKETGPHTEDGDQQCRVAHQEGGARKSGTDEAPDVLVELGGPAEVAVQHASEPLRVLQGQRVVQVVLGSQRRRGLRRRRAAVQQEGHRIAGGQVDRAEDHQRGHEQHRREAEEPSDEIAGHGFAAPIVAAHG